NKPSMMSPLDAEFPGAIPGIDQAVAMKYMGNSTAYFYRFLRDFVRDFDSSPLQLEDDLRKGNLEAILMLSHSVKSIAAYMGASQLATAAAKIEQTTREKRMSDIPKDAGEFRCQLVVMLSHISAHLRDHPALPEEDD